MRLLISTLALTTLAAACSPDAYTLCCRPQTPGSSYQLCEAPAADSSCRTGRNFAPSCCDIEVRALRLPLPLPLPGTSRRALSEYAGAIAMEHC